MHAYGALPTGGGQGPSGQTDGQTLCRHTASQDHLWRLAFAQQGDGGLTLPMPFPTKYNTSS